MSEADYRERAEALLRRAAETPNMRERSELIDQAARYHSLALDSRDATEPKEAANQRR